MSRSAADASSTRTTREVSLCPRLSGKGGDRIRGEGITRIDGNQQPTASRAGSARRLPLRLRDQPRRRHSTTLSVWTSSDSAAFARASTTALAGEGRAAGIACASVVGMDLHMHPDVGVCSIGYHELIAVLLLCQQRGHAVQPPPGLWNGRVTAAPELAATRQLVREAKRQPLIEDCNVRPRDCVPMYGRVGACSRSTAQQTAAIAAGLELGSHDGLDGTIGFAGEHSCASVSWRDRYATPAAVSPGAADYWFAPAER